MTSHINVACSLASRHLSKLKTLTDRVPTEGDTRALGSNQPQRVESGKAIKAKGEPMAENSERAERK